MLEELLTKRSSGEEEVNPAEASLTLLSFLQQELPLGGTASETRFLRFFPLLIESIFGTLPIPSPLSNVNVIASNNRNDINNHGDESKIGYYHLSGGWLDRSDRWSIIQNNSTSSGKSNQSRHSAHHDGSIGEGRTIHDGGGVQRTASSLVSRNSTSSHLKSDPLIHLLSGTGSNSLTSTAYSFSINNKSSDSNLGFERHERGFKHNIQQDSSYNFNLINAMEEETERRPGVHFVLPFRALPALTRIALLAIIDSGVLIEATAGSWLGSGGGHIWDSAENAITLFGRVLSSTSNDLNESTYAIINKMKQEIENHQNFHNHGLRSPKGASVTSSPMPRFSQPFPMLSPPAMGNNRDMQGLEYHRSPFSNSKSIYSPSPSSAQRHGRSATPQRNIYNLILSDNDKTVLHLSMLEYYILIFVRYPIACHKMNPFPTLEKGNSTESSSKIKTVRGYAGMNTYSNTHSSKPYLYGNRKSTIPYGEIVYETLFRSYLRRYLPHDFHPNNIWSINLYNNVQLAKPEMSITDLAGQGMDSKAHLFLRTVIEFWLQGENIPPTTEYALSNLFPNGNVSTNMGQFQDGAIKTRLGLDASYSLASFFSSPTVQLNTQMQSEFKTPALIDDPTNHKLIDILLPGRNRYIPQPRLVQRCVKLLIDQLVCDPDLRRRCYANGSSGFGYYKNSWPLPPAHTILQRSLYNHIRLTLRHSPLNTSDESFNKALDAWLIFLEPWNVVQRERRTKSNTTLSETKTTNFIHTVSDRVAETVSNSSKMTGFRADGMEMQSVLTHPKSTSPGKYNSKWKLYVAANLHLYVVPLAIFLRRARELDFSSGEFARSYTSVMKVFRVFNPYLIETIRVLLDTRNIGIDLSPTQNENEFLQCIVNKHEENLGPYCPPPSNGNGEGMSACSGDMHELLEEMHLRNRKTMEDRDAFDRFFAIGNNENALKRVVNLGKKIADLPKNYSVLKSTGERSNGPDDSEIENIGINDYVPERDDNGVILTDEGRQQILTGSRLCRPIDIVAIGDPMYARVRSYEISFLVTLFVWISDYLNLKIGLSIVNSTMDENDVIHSSSAYNLNDSKLLKLLKDGESSKKLRFRVNLRFLADPRNLVSVFVIGYIMKFLCRVILN